MKHLVTFAQDWLVKSFFDYIIKRRMSKMAQGAERQIRGRTVVYKPVW